MNYWSESFFDIAGLSIHWSSDCNMACQYCYIEKDKHCMATYNKKICQALESGAFIATIKEKMQNRKDQIESLSLWGAEPTINGKYFKNFFYELMDYFSNADSFMFSTNALVGAEAIYNQFYYPILTYCNEHQRKMHFTLQLSLDGPKEYNDASRHIGATDSTLETISLLLEKIPDKSPYLTLQIISKPTLDINYMKDMVDSGIEKFQWYFDFFEEVQQNALRKSQGKENLILCLDTSPTLVDPGYYTVEDGKIFANWLRMLPLVNKSKWRNPQKLLFAQFLNAFEYCQHNDNALGIGRNIFSCSSGKNNLTIDHEGNLYTCNRLCRNAALNDTFKFKQAMTSNSTIDNPSAEKWIKRTYAASAFHDNFLSRFDFFQIILLELAKAGQADEKFLYDQDLRMLAFQLITGLYCHIGAQEDYTMDPFIPPTSYIKLIGNGAIEAFMNYYNYELSVGGLK